MSNNQQKTHQSDQNISSPTQPEVEKGKEWTKEDMEKAKPLPIPEVDDDDETTSK